MKTEQQICYLRLIKAVRGPTRPEHCWQLMSSCWVTPKYTCENRSEIIHMGGKYDRLMRRWDGNRGHPTESAPIEGILRFKRIGRGTEQQQRSSKGARPITPAQSTQVAHQGDHSLDLFLGKRQATCAPRCARNQIGDRKRRLPEARSNNVDTQSSGHRDQHGSFVFLFFERRANRRVHES